MTKFRMQYSKKVLENLSKDDLQDNYTVEEIKEVRSILKKFQQGYTERNLENAHISIDGNVAWFSTNGTVKYNFEHTPERYDSYVDYIKTHAEDFFNSDMDNLSLDIENAIESKSEKMFGLQLWGL